MPTKKAIPRDLADTIRFRQVVQSLTTSDKELLSLVMQVLMDLRHHSRRDTTLFQLWCKNLEPGSRTTSELMRTVRTGAWRDEARRLQRRKVLRIAKAGAR